MADRIAEALADQDIKAVIASPLERAQETAAPIAAAHGLEVRTDERLLEADYSSTGQPRGIWSILRNPRRVWDLRNPLRPSWTRETFVDVESRMRSALYDARRQVAGHEAVLVLHGMPVSSIRRAAEGRPPWCPRPRECALGSVMSLEYEGDCLSKVVYREPAARVPRSR